jgi:hypothetical protein
MRTGIGAPVMKTAAGGVGGNGRHGDGSLRALGAGDADRSGGSFGWLLKHRNPVNGCFGFLLVGSGAGSLDAQAHSAPCHSLRSVRRGSYRDFAGFCPWWGDAL